MIWPVLISGLTLGAAGSLHCVGMCGPLSLALPVHHLSPLRKFTGLLAYQLGRVITYSFIGLLFGLAGRRIYIAGYQQWFSIAAGILIALLALAYFFRRHTLQIRLLDGFYRRVQQWVGALLRKARSAPGFLALGLANGLLPCGMVYIALAATLSFTEVTHSVGFMASFGAGTLPAMMLVAYAGQSLGFQARLLLKKAVPFFVMAVGILLILRGLNLGIPFVSPALPGAPGASLECHPG